MTSRPYDAFSHGIGADGPLAKGTGPPAGPMETTGGNSPAAAGSATTISVAVEFPVDVIALGGELKNTVCVGQGTEAYVSEVHGDLGTSASYRRFVETAARLCARFANDDYVVAHDLHPTYLSTTYARRLRKRRVAVQHHHAHAVSCAIDAGVALPVIGVVCDGTGYGTDGAIWGGEVLLCRADSSERLAHLEYFALPGGDAAARATWRPALSVLRAAFPDRWRSLDLPVLRQVDPQELGLVSRQLEVGVNTPATSSLGRLFDAVACLTDICMWNEHEGQAAIALQAAAANGSHPTYPFGMLAEARPVRIDWRPMVREIVGDVQAGVDASIISARFHETAVAMFGAAAELAMSAAGGSGVDRVVLSGGCFLNDRLRAGLTGRLGDHGATVATHRRVATGDGGLSLGQAVVGSAIAGGQSPKAE